ncbi:hypothetical protein GCM10027270_04220 [Nocardioides ginkgobilobae]
MEESSLASWMGPPVGDWDGPVVVLVRAGAGGSAAGSPPAGAAGGERGEEQQRGGVRAPPVRGAPAWPEAGRHGSTVAGGVKDVRPGLSGDVGTRELDGEVLSSHGRVCRGPDEPGHTGFVG